jgi:hypothetical protein
MRIIHALGRCSTRFSPKLFIMVEFRLKFKKDTSDWWCQLCFFITLNSLQQNGAQTSINWVNRCTQAKVIKYLVSFVSFLSFSRFLSSWIVQLLICYYSFKMTFDSHFFFLFLFFLHSFSPISFFLPISFLLIIQPSLSICLSIYTQRNLQANKYKRVWCDSIIVQRSTWYNTGVCRIVLFSLPYVLFIQINLLFFVWMKP